MKSWFEKQAEEDLQKITKEHEPLLEEMKGTVEIKKKRWLPRLFLPVSSLLVLLSLFSVGAYFLFGNHYTGNVRIREADISSVNAKLKATTLDDRYDLITLTYDEKSGDALYFTLLQTLVSQTRRTELTMHVIVNKRYREKFDMPPFTTAFSLLSYTVVYHQSMAESEYEGQPVYEFNIQAHMETKHEKFYIVYAEITTAPETVFSDHLASLIAAK